MAGDLIAGLHGTDGGLMVDRFSMERAHPADVIGIFREEGQEVGVHPHAALATLGEVELRRCDGEARLTAGHGGETLTIADAGWQVFVKVGLHAGLVVEQVQLRRPATHDERDDSLGLRREVRLVEYASK